MAQASAKKTAKVSTKAASKGATNKVTTKDIAAKTGSSKTSKPASNRPFAQGTGRRKAAVASAYLRKGNGQIFINGRPYDEYFSVITARKECQESFFATAMSSGMMADVKVVGGGFTAQAGAVRLSIARALTTFDASLRPEFKKLGFLTVDSRVKERKKYGQKAARKKFQFTKR